MKRASPYRDAAIVAPVAPEKPPLWQRVAARLAPKELGAGGWPWYRRAVGGRWARVVFEDWWYGNGWTSWARIRVCPLHWRPGWETSRLVVDGADYSVAAAVEATRYLHGPKCSCEVYE